MWLNPLLLTSVINGGLHSRFGHKSDNLHFAAAAWPQLLLSEKSVDK